MNENYLFGIQDAIDSSVQLSDAVYLIDGELVTVTAEQARDFKRKQKRDKKILDQVKESLRSKGFIVK